MKSMIALAFCVLTLFSATTLASDDRAQFNDLLKSTAQVRVQIKYPDWKIPKTNAEGKIKILREPRIYNSGSSGVIVGRKTNTLKSEPKYTYHVLTVAHAFIHENGPSIKRALEINVWIKFMGYDGLGKIVTINATSAWVSNKQQYDVAVISFKTSEELPIVRLQKDIPRNLFGREACSIGFPLALAPMVFKGIFGANSPTMPNHRHIIGTSVPAVAGSSGSGVYYKKDGKWVMMGIVLFIVTPDKLKSSNISGVLRGDAIWEFLSAINKAHFLEVK